MNIRCPGCGAQFSMEVAFQGTHARQAILAALELPNPIASLVVSYLALFRPGKNALSFDRVGKLCAELNSFIVTGTVERNGLQYPASIDIWREGLELVVQARDESRLRLPLKSHAYLLEIIATLADKAAGAAERDKHDKLRSGQRESRPAPAASDANLDEYGLDRNSNFYQEMRTQIEQQERAK